MKRVAHLLGKNTRRSRPEHLIFVDVETSPTSLDATHTQHNLKLGWACYWRNRNDGKADTLEWLFFKDKAQFWDWVVDKTSNKRRVHLIAHNVNFDFPVMEGFTRLSRRGWELTKQYQKGYVSILTWRKKGKTLMVLDNCNYFSGKLAKWGETIGYPKLEIDFDRCTYEELKTYCRRDVEIMVKLWEWWFAFLDEHDLGAWGVTLPSQAFNAYRHRFMEYRIQVHNDPVALSLERASYHGGRVECFRVGDYEPGPFYKLDVNSMYPYVMLEKQYPRRLVKALDYLSIDGLGRALSRWGVIARVKLEVDEPWFFHRVNGKTAYPIGRFTETLTTPELQLAVERDWVLEVEQAALYELAPIFTAYVNYFYPLKVQYQMAGDKPRRAITKGFLNYLYGKFGQRGTETKFVGKAEPDKWTTERVYNVKTGTWETWYYLGGKIMRQVVTDESYHSFPAIAAHVTAHARMYLYQLIQEAGHEHTYYCDTDSVIVDEQGVQSLRDRLDATSLGALKSEGVSDTLTIHAPKDYVFGTQIKRKGVRKNALEIAPGTFEQETFPSIRGLLGHTDQERYVTYKVTKELKRTITGGVTQGSGRVTPFELPLSIEGPRAETLDEYQERVQKEAWSETHKIPQRIVFMLWDYRQGQPRKLRSKDGLLVDGAHARTDTLATELGFQDGQELMAAVRAQVQHAQTL